MLSSTAYSRVSAGAAATPERAAERRAEAAEHERVREVVPKDARAPDAEREEGADDGALGVDEPREQPSRR